MIARTTALLASALALMLVIGTASALTVHGMEIAEKATLTDWGKQLQLAGAAVVDRRYLPFYVVALYHDPHDPEAAQIAEGMAPCRVAITWLMPVLDEAAAREYWGQALAAAVAEPAQVAPLQPALDRVIKALGPARRGDVLVFDYHPDSGLRVERNGARVGQFAGLDLNRTVLRVWLGPNAGAIRAQLLPGASAAE